MRCDYSDKRRFTWGECRTRALTRGHEYVSSRLKGHGEFHNKLLTSTICYSIIQSLQKKTLQQSISIFTSTVGIQKSRVFFNNFALLFVTMEATSRSRPSKAGEKPTARPRFGVLLSTEIWTLILEEVCTLISISGNTC